MQIKILVVDDEPDLELLIRQRFRKKIKNGELAFVFARNGKQALEKLDAIHDIDMVMTDINMPEMDGLTFLDKIKNRNIAMKSIVVSAYGDMDNIRLAMNRGAFDFVTKPIDFEDLEITITKTYKEISTIREGLQAKEAVEDAIRDKIKAEQNEKIKQQFLANISHEIRTPMNAVVGMTNLLLKQSPRKDQMQYLQAISQSADNLLVIINDILDLSKIEAGKMQLEQLPFSIREILQIIHGIFKFKAEENGLVLKITCGDEVPEQVMGDPVRLNQILVNLVANAIKFTEAGEVVLDTTVSAHLSNKVDIRFTVNDTGIGIPPDRLDQIFDSFAQASGDTMRKYGGTGLGLSISKQLVELQQGQISVSSEVGHGSEFTVIIPYGLAGPVEKHQPEIDNTLIGRVKDIRILLVEDNDFNIIVAKDSLESEIEGVMIDIAKNGEEAIKKLTVADYHLVLMDLNMPVMNGYQAIKRIRSFSPPKKDIPVIAMTATAESTERQKCLDIGMNEYIAKPFDIEEVVQKITKVLEES